MSCEGDKIEGYDTSQVCYKTEACPGCSKCIIKCGGCENCPPETPVRLPEVGDYVTVKTPIITTSYRGPKWIAAMDMAIGRTAWVKKGNPVEGFSLKFTTTKKEILDQFLYPLEALKLAMPADNSIDKMIKISKEGSPNEDI
jgi:hypothetical protein